MRVNRAELADIIGKSTTSISRLVKEGMPVESRPKGPSGEWQFDTAKVIEWLIEGPVAFSLPQQIEEAKTRRKVARAGLKELELGERQRVLFHIDEVNMQLLEQLAVVKSQLITMPNRLAHEMALTSDPADVRHILTEELEDIASAMTGFDPSQVP
jgi:phage terminase Nu1 subunit (DNA packaging protein)